VSLLPAIKVAQRTAVMGNLASQCLYEQRVVVKGMEQWQQGLA
jgi:hypothetical protein